MSNRDKINRCKCSPDCKAFCCGKGKYTLVHMSTYLKNHPRYLKRVQEKQNESRKAKFTSHEAYLESQRRKASFGSNKRWSNKNERLKMSERSKEMWKDPEYRKRISEASKEKFKSVSFINKLFCNKKPSKLELIVRRLLRRGTVPYFHQFPVGGFIADFYIPSSNLLIECDGEYWHSREDKKKIDVRKNKKFKELGFKLLRLDEKTIKTNQIRTVQLISEML